VYKISGIKKSYGFLPVLAGIDMELLAPGINCLMGPSGCGKTTLLKIIAGLLPADAGDLGGLGDQPLSICFQEDRLLPWRTVTENIALVLPKNSKEKVAQVLAEAGLAAYANNYSRELSGGLKQRVNLARALAVPAALYLLDEPFKSLHEEGKEELMEWLLARQKEQNACVLLITHDPDEAAFLADRSFTLTDKPAKVDKIEDRRSFGLF